ncbi:uncharacterized protein LOC142233553 [Haematobia irritans]|uniref:uncharacterized protein LOC142233553 n=1 Tax=Haematobia irritans TaxID=7368 RepID=UPI003F4FA2E8
MAVFVNVLYKNKKEIVPIKCGALSLTTNAICEDIKEHFQILGHIQFFDAANGVKISDDILPDYINQFRYVPGWVLEAKEFQRDEVIEFQEILCDIEDDFEVEEVASGLTVAATESKSIQEIQSLETQNVVSDEMNDLNNVSALLDLSILKELEDIEFQIIVREHSVQCLENSDRTKISKIIIKYILQNDVNFVLTRADYIYISDLICKLFPQEPKDIYYSPAKFGQKASGKLYDAYNNLRKRLSKSGFLKRRGYQPKTIPGAVFQDTSDDIEFLKSTSRMNDEYFAAWCRSLQQRQHLLRKLGSCTREYLQLFPVFRTNHAGVFELFKSDVASLYPTSQ